MKGAEAINLSPSIFVRLMLIFVASSKATSFQDPSFIYNGFKDADVSVDGTAYISTKGLLMLTNYSRNHDQGHAFYRKPFVFKNSSTGNAFSFSTSFVFAIVPNYPEISSHGMAFVVAPSKGLPGGSPDLYLGLFNRTNNGNSSNHVFAVELDTMISGAVKDINDNHVGIDINSLESVAAAPAKYYINARGSYKNLSLISGKPMQVWIDYDGFYKMFHVTVAPINISKPKTPLLSLHYDISPIFLESMYVGFSASTGTVLTSHYILGWSFKMNGQAQAIDLSRLPRLPRTEPKEISKIILIGLPIILPVSVLVLMIGGLLMVRRMKKYEEIIEDWERIYGTHRFSYKDLYIATDGFREKELLGIGGFGRVYRGVLPSSRTEVAVKRVSHDSRQGIREFITEIVSLGQLRHRNLVQLLGYCRRKGELLLVYDFMPNGSLDKLLFCPLSSELGWSKRFQIIKGVASGLFYLHEEWEQVIIHRDIKASNVLLDGNFNGRLGDFGLARLYDHGTNPQTTHLVGTVGYLAPEMVRTGKATTSTDVYAFGAFMLEVVCGRRPIEPRETDENRILVDWIVSCWSRGVILEAIDPSLGSEYEKEEIELVLKLGLLCSRAIPRARPNMGQVVQYLEKNMPLPELSSEALDVENLAFGHFEKFDDFAQSSTFEITNTNSLITESLLSSGR